MKCLFVKNCYIDSQRLFDLLLHGAMVMIALLLVNDLLLVLLHIVFRHFDLSTANAAVTH